jgi:hypothetical protein
VGENFNSECDLYQNPVQKQQARNMRQKCLIDLKCQSKYRSLEPEIKIAKLYEDMLTECITHYATQTKPQIVSPQRFLSWLNSERKPYSKKTTANNIKPEKLTMQQVMEL